MSERTCTWVINEDGEAYPDCDPRADISEWARPLGDWERDWDFCPFCGGRIVRAPVWKSHADMYGADPHSHGPYCGEVVVV